jgi:hypothetical protein
MNKYVTRNTVSIIFDDKHISYDQFWTKIRDKSRDHKIRIEYSNVVYYCEVNTNWEYLLWGDYV